MTPSKTLLHRIEKLQKALRSKKIEGAFVSEPSDLFYLTKIPLSHGQLGIYKNKGCLFVDGRYFETAQKHSPIPVEKLEAKAVEAFFKGCKTLAVDGDKMCYTQFLQVNKLGPKVVSDPAIFRHLRMIKDKDEIKIMQKSARFAYKAYEAIKKQLKPGITEIAVAKELRIYCLKHGAEKMSFDPIIAFGKNTSLPHHHPGSSKLKKNDIVLLDLGVVIDGYCSDMTRVVFVGTPDPTLKHLYDVNHDAQKAALAKCRPGVTLKELDEAARKVMARAKLEEYFIHSLGHGVGLEIHEAPRISKTGADRDLKLEEGMVITIEPGLYLPGKGGVRYEDTVVITAEGVTNFYP